MVTPAEHTIHCYRRVSTEEQAASGLGLDAQRAALAAEVDRRGWADVQWPTDDGWSAATLDRPALADTLATLRPGDVLAVAKLDRLSRSLMDFAGLMDRAHREGWSLVVLDVNVDTTTAAGALMANVMASFADYERRIIGERTKAALAALRDRGHRLGRPVEMDRSAEDRVAELRREGLSMAAVAEALNAEDVPTARGGRWHASTVKMVLDRRAALAEAAS